MAVDMADFGVLNNSQELEEKNNLQFSKELRFEFLLHNEITASI